jgi:hypothetical protein
MGYTVVDAGAPKVVAGRYSSRVPLVRNCNCKVLCDTIDWFGSRAVKALTSELGVPGSSHAPGYHKKKSKVVPRLVTTSGRWCVTSDQVAVYLYQTHGSGRSLWVTSLGLPE